MQENSIQLTKGHKWIGSKRQMHNYVKSQWEHAEGGFDWFTSTNEFIIRSGEGQGGFAVGAFSLVDGIVKSTFTFDTPFYISDVIGENHILSNPYNTRNAISHEKRHLQQSIQFHHGSLRNFDKSLMELDAINYQRSVGSWNNTTTGFKIRIRNYEQQYFR